MLLFVGAHPPVNLYETADDYVLTAELPGSSAADIDLTIERNRVTLRGERKIEHPSDASLHRVERRGGRFRRTIEPRENQLMKVPPEHFEDWMPTLPKPGSTTSLISIDSRAPSSASTMPHQRDSLS